MNLAAVIIVCAMLVPVAGRLADIIMQDGQDAVICCHHAPDGEQHPAQERAHTDREGCPDQMCPIGCDCSCCIHVMAFEYHFYSVPGVVQRPFQYSLYRNDYRFDFFTPVFEPPRLV